MAKISAAIFLSASALLIGSAPVKAQDTESPCSTENHRAFDFWLGDWDVTPVNPSPGDSTVRRSSITLEEDGCAILERYRTSAGYSGMSINFYHAALGEWHQTWIDNQGAPIEMKGGIEDGRMVMRWTPSEGRAARMTWTPMEDGTVRQHWETSDDEGETWTSAFDGIYVRRPGD